jgi:iron complex outermembrane receptor protein
LNSAGFIGNATTDIYKTNFKTAQYLSDYYLENASFVRMDNVVLGYNFGSIAKKLNLSASFIIQNAFVITKYSGLDPEVFGGLDKNIYPKPRIYSLGVNLGF